MRMRLLGTLAIVLSMAAAAGAQPPDLSIDVGDVEVGEVDPGFVSSSFTIRAVVVDAVNARVLVQYDVERSDGTSEQKQLAQFSLDGDRFVNYKMAMLMLLREAIVDPDLRVSLSLVAETADSSLPTIATVAAASAP